MQDAISPKVEAVEALELPLGSRADKYETLAQEQQQRKVQEVQAVVAQREQATQQQAAEGARKWATISYVKRLEAERSKTTWIRFGFVIAGAAILAVIAKRASRRSPKHRIAEREPDDSESWQENQPDNSLPLRPKGRRLFRKWRTGK